MRQRVMSREYKNYGNLVKGKISGLDLVSLLKNVVVEKGYTIFIIGGKKGVTEQTKKSVIWAVKK